MPDWFYRTISKPLLFRLPATTARSLALGVMGSLARLPLGPTVIDLLGHMRADPRLRRTLLGVEFPSVAGLGPWLDAGVRATPALARFGVGFIEVGPVTVEPIAAPHPVERRPDDEALWYPDPPPNPGVAELARRLSQGHIQVHLIVRVTCAADATAERATADCRQVIERLASVAAVFSLATTQHAVAGRWTAKEWGEHLAAAAIAARGGVPPRPLLLCLPADLSTDDLSRVAAPALSAGISGLVIDGTIADKPGGRLVGRPAREPALRLLRHLRGRWPELPLVAGGGLHEPEDAVAFRAAGADLVALDTGLVYTGPGLPKRCNEALLAVGPTRHYPADEAPAPARPAEATWLWTTLMGLGMLVGSILALAIAATRVVLPYDEAFTGLTRGAQLAAINDRLLSFMAHDRVSLAGTMIAIGVMYSGLSLGGIRRGVHWAQQAVFASAFAGFATFFLFLGFGYFDPFHAFVTGVLLQFLLLGVHSRLGPPLDLPPLDLRGDAVWRRSLWGQLLLVIHGVALLVAGLTISTIGSSLVFVHEDLEFMRTTREALVAAHPRLVPLVAHDRATFGGMLVSSGLVFLLPALWGFRRGTSWLWWTFLLAGMPAYAAAIGVHYAVGYTDWMHLLPAFGGLALFLVGLALARGSLCDVTRSTDRKSAPAASAS